MSLGALRDIGIKSDQDFDVSGVAPQSAYTPVIQTMKNKGSNYGQAITCHADGAACARKRRSRASPA